MSIDNKNDPSQLSKKLVILEFGNSCFFSSKHYNIASNYEQQLKKLHQLRHYLAEKQNHLMCLSKKI